MSTLITKKKLRIMVEGVDFFITSTVLKADLMTDLIFEVGGESVYGRTYSLSAKQFAEFAKKSSDILTI